MKLPIALGRYTVVRELASGGMATVYLGRIHGGAGFERTVAVKRLHPHLARDPSLAVGLVDEARLVARVEHPNVVPVLDVVWQHDEVFLVLEYVRGESLAGLLRACTQEGQNPPLSVVLAILAGVLRGLHAAHTAKDEQGNDLSIIHRDVSPQNILVGTDGVARVLDFGVAKASRRLLETTREGKLKGKIPYMAPEQISGAVTHRIDVYAAGVVLWEALTCRGLFREEGHMQLLYAVLSAHIPPPSRENPQVPPEVDRITLKALARNPEDRYATADEMADAIEASGLVASPSKVAAWVQRIAAPVLAVRDGLVREVEGTPLVVDASTAVDASTEVAASAATSPAVSSPGTPRTRVHRLAPLGGAALLVFAVLWLWNVLPPSHHEPYRSAEAGFSVEFPGGEVPIVSSKKVGADQITTVQVQYLASTYLVSYCNLSIWLHGAPFDAARANSQLDFSRNLLVEGMDSKLVQETPISLDGFLGRDLRVHSWSGGVPIRMRSRWYATPGWLYQVSVVSPLGAGSEQRATSFLDSFRIDAERNQGH